MTLSKRIVLCLALLLLLGIPLGMTRATAYAQDSRYFPQTGYSIPNDAIWDYFQARGGISTFGYPVSNAFLLQGFPVQIFQRHVIQSIGEQARPINLLDPSVMPVTALNGSSFPAYDANIAATAPRPEAPDYTRAVQQHIAATVPNEWEGVSVGFLDYFYSAAPAASPGPTVLIALEVWGFPTSAPARDPNNANFVYQRFQRGIMHYDASQNVTRGILLGDAFKSVLTGTALPADLANDLADSPFLRIYAPGQPNSLARTAPALLPPITLENTDLTNAFDGDATPPPPAATPEAPIFTQVDVYLIGLETGGPIGCNDSVVPVSVAVAPTQAPLTAALQSLFAIKTEFYGQSGLYNSLYRTDLHIDDIELANGTATIRLVGEYQIGGTCDEPRVRAQLEQTALQFATIDRAEFYINGEKIN